MNCAIQFYGALVDVQKNMTNCNNDDEQNQSFRWFWPADFPSKYTRNGDSRADEKKIPSAISQLFQFY